MVSRSIRSGLGITSLILIAGAIVLMFFVVLGGVKTTTPLNRTYFLSADTSSLTGSGRAVSNWNYFYVCGEGNTNCGAAVPALPIGYAWVGGTEGVPESLVGSYSKNTTSRYYFFMWKFGWVLYLIGLVFTVFAFFLSLLAPCSRLASGAAGAILFFAWFWFSIAVALMTATFVKLRNALNAGGIPASIGRYAFGFSWAAWFCMTIASFLLCAGLGRSNKNDKHYSSDDAVINRADRPARKSNMTGNVGFFRRQRHDRSARGSFVDNESQRRVVKEEY